MLSMDKAWPDSLGYLVLNEDGAVLASSGDLENNERIANTFYNVLTLTDKLVTEKDPFKGLTVLYKEGYKYDVAVSNKRIYILKRRHSFSEQDGSNSTEQSPAVPTSNSRDENSVLQT